MVSVGTKVGGLGHDGNAIGYSSVKLVQTSDQVHISTDEDELFGEINGVVHELLDFALHLQLHFYDVLLRADVPCLSTLPVSRFCGE